MGYLGKNLKANLKFLINKKKNIIIPDKVKSVKTSTKIGITLDFIDQMLCDLGNLQVKKTKAGTKRTRWYLKAAA